MKLMKKIALGMAATAVLAVPTMAEEVTIGAEIPPIASLVVLGGNTQMSIDDLTPTAAITDSDDCIAAAKFFVNTNMPKWNVYLALANGGKLVSRSGKELALTSAYLTFSQNLNTCDDAACTNTSATVVGVTDIPVAINSDIQNLNTIVNNGTVTNPPLAGTWMVASDINTFGVDLKVSAQGSTAPTLAGEYNEIVYLTLATTY